MYRYNRINIRGKKKMKVVGFLGEMQVGKTTAAEYYVKKFNEKNRNKEIYTATKIAFADTLKEVAGILYPQIKDDIYINKNKLDTITGKTVRQILQLLGTEVCRNIDSNTWTNLMYNKIQAMRREHIEKEADPITGALNIHKKYEVIFIDDIRFENEIDCLQDIGKKY